MCSGVNPLWKRQAEQRGRGQTSKASDFGLPSMHLEHHGWRTWSGGEKKAKQKYFYIRNPHTTAKHTSHPCRSSTKIKEKRQKIKENRCTGDTQVALDMKMDQEDQLRQIKDMTREQRALRERASELAMSGDGGGWRLAGGWVKGRSLALPCRSEGASSEYGGVFARVRRTQ